jgi:hypothetical protein
MTCASSNPKDAFHETQRPRQELIPVLLKERMRRKGERVGSERLVGPSKMERKQNSVKIS